MLKKAKNLYRIQREAKKVKKELRSIQVEAEARGVKVVVDAQQKVVSIEIASDTRREDIADLIKDAMNRALSKAQIVAAEKMKGVMGELGLGGN